MLRRRAPVSKQIAADGLPGSRLWVRVWDSPRRQAAVGPTGFLRGFGLSRFQFRLAKDSGFRRVRARLQVCFLEEVTPAFVPVGRALIVFELLQRGFRVGSSLDNFDYSRRFVGTDVVADDNVRCLNLVVCQMCSLSQPRTLDPTLRVCAAGMISK